MACLHNISLILFYRATTRAKSDKTKKMQKLVANPEFSWWSIFINLQGILCFQFL